MEFPKCTWCNRRETCSDTCSVMAFFNYKKYRFNGSFRFQISFYYGWYWWYRQTKWWKCICKQFSWECYPIEYFETSHRWKHATRARRTIENTFGIAASRFRIFYRPIKAEVKTVVFITKAVVALHNFLMSENNDNLQYCSPNLTDQEGPNGYIPATIMLNNKGPRTNHWGTPCNSSDQELKDRLIFVRFQRLLR